MKLKMASDNICFFIIECYSFDEIVDFVIMPSNQILCTMVVNIFLKFIGNARGSTHK